jgi:DNA-binding MarR family transcriptional regulator
MGRFDLPRPDVRPRSRRTRRRTYFAERLFASPPDEQARDPNDPAAAASALLIDAGSLLSALRPLLRAEDLDLRMARLALCFPTAGRPLRAADIAWRLGITTGAASRLLDHAEARGIVDKHYLYIDRRGTWVCLTTRGRAIREQVETVVRNGVCTERRRGKAFGIRAYLDREPSQHLEHGADP